MSEDHTLLPSNATALERDLESVGTRITSLSDDLSLVRDPDRCPAAILPWMAWGMGIESWDNAWPEETQRRVINDAISQHRTKGTKAAVVKALEQLDFTVELSEWFDNGDDPYIFRLKVFSGDLSLAEGAGPQVHQRILQQIKFAKPVRSHAIIETGEDFVTDVPVLRGAKVRRRSCTRNELWHPSEATSWSLGLVPCQRVRRGSYRVIELTPPIQPTQQSVSAQSNSRVRMASRITHSFTT